MLFGTTCQKMSRIKFVGRLTLLVNAGGSTWWLGGFEPRSSASTADDRELSLLLSPVFGKSVANARGTTFSNRGSRFESGRARKRP